MNGFGKFMKYSKISDCGHKKEPEKNFPGSFFKNITKKNLFLTENFH